MDFNHILTYLFLVKFLRFSRLTLPAREKMHLKMLSAEVYFYQGLNLAYIVDPDQTAPECRVIPYLN